MQGFTQPVHHEWLARGHTYGKIAMEPFGPGFGLPVGNAYRQVLLSSIAGSAPTWVKIEGVPHEFSNLVGVREDTLDIILNLQKVIFRLHIHPSKVLHLRVQGARTVTARDFEPDPDVQVLTPNVVLATLGRACSLEMEVCVEWGRGHQLEEARVWQALPTKAMPMDANFSPVKRVSFYVKTQPSGYERLVIQMWTNGTVTPETALDEASRILDGQCVALIDLPRGTAG